MSELGVATVQCVDCGRSVEVTTDEATDRWRCGRCAAAGVPTRADRPWTRADREMVANVYHWNASRCQPENCPGALECCYAGDLSMGGFGAVLDALTAAGWRPARDYLPAAAEALDRHAARVREQTADGIAADIGATIFAGAAMPMDLCPPSGSRPPVSAYAEWAARIARAHRTTEEPTDA